MELDKIVVGKTYQYKSRITKGKAKVTDIKTLRTGDWVTLNDENRDRYVTVRPSQIYGLHAKVPA